MLQQVQLVQAAPSLQRADPANANGSLACIATPPAGLNRPTRGFSPTKLRLLPFGTGADNATFTLQVVGWSRIGTIWVPSILFEGTATLSTFVGVAGATVIETERFADTLAMTANKGVANVDNVILSPADNTPAHVVIDAKGAEIVEVRVSTGGNALYAWL